MQNKFYNHHHSHHKSIFLPMLCRLSIKDITLSPRRKRPICSAPRDPSSPKVSCIGQVKRSSRVTSFPSTAAPHRHGSYSKLKKLFSGKSLLPPNSGAAASAGNVKKINDQLVAEKVATVDTGELDPPLPVVKRVGRDEVNIWNRRISGTERLQIQLPNRNSQSPTTV